MVRGGADELHVAFDVGVGERGEEAHWRRGGRLARIARGSVEGGKHIVGHRAGGLLGLAAQRAVAHSSLKVHELGHVAIALAADAALLPSSWRCPTAGWSLYKVSALPPCCNALQLQLACTLGFCTAQRSAAAVGRAW